MGIFEHFPYTNFHEINLDWLLNTVKGITTTVENLETKMNQTATYDIVFTNYLGNITCNKTYEEIVSSLADLKDKALYNGIPTTGASQGGSQNSGYVDFCFLIGIGITNTNVNLTFLEIRVNYDDTITATPVFKTI